MPAWRLGQSSSGVIDIGEAGQPCSQIDERVGRAPRRCTGVACSAACTQQILPGAIDSVAMDPLHNSSQFVISRARAACCVVFLVNSQLLIAKRRLASHPDPSVTFSRELCSKSLKQFLQSALTTLSQQSFELPFQCLASCADCPQTARGGPYRQTGRTGVRHCLVQVPCRNSNSDASQQLWGGCQPTVGL